MNNKFKIALISNTSNFFNSFMINHVTELSKKYKLFICCNNASDLKKKLPRNISLADINFKREFNIFYDIISFFIIFLFFVKNKPNYSISFTSKLGLIVAITSFFARIPNRTHWFTGQIWANKKGISKIFFKTIDKIIFFLSHNVLVDSPSQKKFLLDQNIISNKKSTVLLKGSVGGVDTSRFKFNKSIRLKLRKKLLISKNTFVFLYLGRINKDKGVVDLVKAFERIQNNHDVKLIFVGPVEDKKILKSLKYKKKILHFDFSSNPENWFSLADILCLPSYREGFGTVVIEAASSGIPALCSNIYGLKDSIINHKTGFFHKAGSIEDIKKKMLYIIKNKKKIKKFGFFAKKRAKKYFEQSLITKKLLDFIYLKIIKNDNENLQ